MPMSKLQTFTCAICGETFQSPRSDVDADAEAEALWGVREAHARADFIVVCDDCFEHRTPEERAAIARDYRARR